MGSSPNGLSGLLGLGGSKAPQMGTTSDSKGVKQSYYKDPAQVPQSGGWVMPKAPPGAPQGIARNFVVPQAPAPNPQRQQLAAQMTPNMLTAMMAQYGGRGSAGGGRNPGYTTSGRGGTSGFGGRSSSTMGGAGLW